ncbi:PQQ-dependent sugar dehydrogenase [Adhaeribacter rhizoryzae]|uniref:PQQ-dependent sugar dehydrogenase n=1 Tax=Adhaeribacter rhizoryzae TaxID=2607907 RepID=A0A5M6CWS1_9BACT|nr:PQQ-dependent sugar dehydrogenase [Adhaeribacter rhizoryzae]KAA5539671.1 PQQ-dependent sugar dehydrogenase [Adhaeribacter rhizoryzae]
MKKIKVYGWINPTILCLILVLNLNSTYGQSVETSPKVAPQQKPASAGQTRVSAVKTSTKFSFKVITEGLSSPWGLDFLPDGRMLVSELAGKIRIVSKDGTVGNALKGAPPVRVFGVSGMMDVKVSPNFETSRYVFWTYPEPTGENQSVNCIARGKLSLDETSLEEVKVIYRASTTGQDGFHLGSRMLFDKSGLLYVTFGDRFQESVRVQAQELNSSLGKIIRINQDGTYAKGNPFISDPKARKEIWSLGHRNPQGLAFNPVTGDLWSSEHGPIAGDELNIIRPGANYGWPIISYGQADGGGSLSGSTQKEGMAQPVYYWDPAVAPAGMTFYTGNLIPEWKNNLFVGALRGSHIIRLVIDHKTSRVIGEERLLADERQRFRHIIQGPDEALYAITHQGRLYRIGN